ncbi:MAG: hypothetical protein ACRDCY_18870 [Aeromonas veronii]
MPFEPEHHHSSDMQQHNGDHGKGQNTVALQQDLVGGVSGRLFGIV